MTLDIITITRDDAAGIAATLRSTSGLRDHPGVRQIVIDGSAEPARSEVRALCNEQKGVEYRWQEPSGISKAFNLGLASSRGDWVWFLNGRDEVHPDLDPTLLLRLIELTRADALVGEIEFLQTRQRSPHPPFWKLWPPLYWMPHPATMLRRQLFDRFGGFNEGFRIGMDGELWLRLFSKDVVVDLLAIPVTKYDLNGISSRTASVETVREVDRMVVSHLRLLLKIWLRQGYYLVNALRGRLLGR